MKLSERNKQIFAVVAWDAKRRYNEYLSYRFFKGWLFAFKHIGEECFEIIKCLLIVFKNTLSILLFIFIVPIYRPISIILYPFYLFFWWLFTSIHLIHRSYKNPQSKHFLDQSLNRFKKYGDWRIVKD